MNLYEMEKQYQDREFTDEPFADLEIKGITFVNCQKVLPVFQL